MSTANLHSSRCRKYDYE